MEVFSKFTLAVIRAVAQLLSVRPLDTRSTLDAFPYDFVSVILGVGFVCALLWCFARQKIHKSRWWLALFSVLFAATITPTCFPFIFGDWIVAPATLISLALLDRSNLLFGLLFGVLPILVVAGLIFMCLFRRYRHEAVA